jgi:plasmid maintenance system antidote protein VapI
MAIRLDKAFGGGADTWHHMQAAYDMAQAMRHADRINVRRVAQPALVAE